MSGKVTEFNPSGGGSGGSGFGSIPGCGFFFSGLENGLGTGPGLSGGPNPGGGYSFSMGASDMTNMASGEGGEGTNAIGAYGAGGGWTASNIQMISGGFGQQGTFLPVNARMPGCDGYYTDTSSGTFNSPMGGVMVGANCQAHVGTFTLNTSTGSQTVATPFTPDLVIFFYIGDPDPSGIYVGINDSRSGAFLMLGAADILGNQWVAHYRAGDAHYPGQRQFLTSACIRSIGTSFGGVTTVDQQANMVSMSGNSFTLDVTAAGADSAGLSMQVNYMALKAGTGGGFQCGHGTQGDTTLTCAFEPEALIFGSCQSPNMTAAQGTGFGVGGSDGTTQNALWGAAISSGAYGYYDNTSAFYLATIDPSTSYTIHTVAQMTATPTGTGANLTWAVDDSSGNLFGWIAMAANDYQCPPASVLTFRNRLRAETPPHAPSPGAPIRTPIVGFGNEFRREQ